MAPVYAEASCRHWSSWSRAHACPPWRSGGTPVPPRQHDEPVADRPRERLTDARNPAPPQTLHRTGELGNLLTRRRRHPHPASARRCEAAGSVNGRGTRRPSGVGRGRTHASLHRPVAPGWAGQSMVPPWSACASRVPRVRAGHPCRDVGGRRGSRGLLGGRNQLVVAAAVSRICQQP